MARSRAGRRGARRDGRARPGAPARARTRAVLGPARRARGDAPRDARVRAPRRRALASRRQAVGDGAPPAASLRRRGRREEASGPRRGDAEPEPGRRARAGPCGRAAAPADRIALLPGEPVPPRSRARRWRAARERRRAERGRPVRRGRRLRTRLVAECDRAARAARLLPELPPAQLDRRRCDARALVLHGLDRRSLCPPARPPELPGRPAGCPLLGRTPRAGRTRADAAALGAAAPRQGLGRQFAATASSASARAKPSRPQRDFRVGHGGSASRATSPSSARRGCYRGSARTPPASTSTGVSAASTRWTCARARSSRPTSGPTAISCSRSRRAPQELHPRLPVRDGPRTLGRTGRDLFYDYEREATMSETSGS